MSLDAPLVLFKGESRRLTYTVFDPDTGLPVDMTATHGSIVDIQFEIKRRPGDPDPATLALFLGGGVQLISSGTSGQFRVNLTPVMTQSIVSGTYTYDVVGIWGDTSRTLFVRPRPVHIKDVVNLP